MEEPEKKKKKKRKAEEASQAAVAPSVETEKQKKKKKKREAAAAAAAAVPPLESSATSVEAEKPKKKKKTKVKQEETPAAPVAAKEPKAKKEKKHKTENGQIKSEAIPSTSTSAPVVYTHQVLGIFSSLPNGEGRSMFGNGEGQTKPLEAWHRGPDGLAIIARPLASDELTKRCFKLVKKAAKVKKLKRGVREVVKAIRKGETGLLLIAGNITPIDVITHLPALCEDKGIDYIYVRSKEELGTSSLTKRSTSCILLPPPADDAPYKSLFDEVRQKVKLATPTAW